MRNHAKKLLSSGIKHIFVCFLLIWMVLDYNVAGYWKKAKFVVFQ